MMPLRNPAAIELGRLADSGRTGRLHLSGESGGVIHLSEGDVVYADSRRTPDLATRLAQATVGRDLISPLERNWLLREAIVDAALELLSARARHLKFRPSGDEPAVSDMGGMPVAALINEVSRRREVMQQLSVLLIPDTAVARDPGPRSRAIHVSDIQWAILIRAGNPVTPRGLAMQLGQSVFGTTIEVFRMVTLDLLKVVDAPARPADQEGQFNRNRPVISFIQALAGERGYSQPGR
jgi:hypothetical protein